MSGERPAWGRRLDELREQGVRLPESDRSTVEAAALEVAELWMESFGVSANAQDAREAGQRFYLALRAETTPPSELIAVAQLDIDAFEDEERNEAKRAKSEAHWAARMLAAKLIKGGNPLPDELRSFVGAVLDGSLTAPRKPSGQGQGWVWAWYTTLARCVLVLDRELGLPPYRNPLTDMRCGLEIVAEAAERAGLPGRFKTVKNAYEKYTRALRNPPPEELLRELLDHAQ